MMFLNVAAKKGLSVASREAFEQQVMRRLVGRSELSKVAEVSSDGINSIISLSIGMGER